MLLVTGNAALIERTTNALKQSFQITIYYEPRFFVGFKIQRNLDEQTVALSQIKYVERILKRFNMESAHPQYTPMEVGLRLTEPENGTDDTEFRSMIGALLYLARGTRPDIAFAVNALSQAQKCSTATEKKLRSPNFSVPHRHQEFRLNLPSCGK